MKNIINEINFKNEILIADGATGTNYFDDGLQAGDPPELWNIEKSQSVIELHRKFIQAGANIILTNTFGANELRLKFHGIDSKLNEININAVKLAKAAVTDLNKSNVMIGGSIGPTGEIFQANGGTFSYSKAIDVFYNQSIALKKGGVDFLWIETLSSLEEVDAALTASDKSGMKAVITMSFDTAKKTMMGVSPYEFVQFINNRRNKPLAIGANCGIGPPELLISMKEIKDNLNNEILLVAKGNCGIPEYKNGKVTYNGNPKVMSKYALLCKLIGIDIIGGCCGTTPEHILSIKNSLRDNTRSRLKLNSMRSILQNEQDFSKLISCEIGLPWGQIALEELKPPRKKTRRRKSPVQ